MAGFLEVRKTTIRRLKAAKGFLLAWRSELTACQARILRASSFFSGYF